MPRLLKRERIGVVAKFMARVNKLPDDRRRALRVAALKYQDGDSRPLIDFLKALVTDPAMLAALIKLLPVLIPLLLLLL